MHINHGQLFLNIGFAPSLSWIIALDPLIVSIFFWNSVGRLLIISANDLFWMWCNSAQSNVTQWNLIVGVYTLSSHNEQCKLFFWLPYFTSAVTCLITCTLHFEYLCSGFPSYGLMSGLSYQCHPLLLWCGRDCGTSDQLHYIGFWSSLKFVHGNLCIPSCYCPYAWIVVFIFWHQLINLWLTYKSLVCGPAHHSCNMCQWL